MSLSLEDILSAQIKKADQLLLKISSKGFWAIQSLTEQSAFDSVSHDIDGWERETVEYINVYYGEGSQQSVSFHSFNLKKKYQPIWGININENWHSLQEEVERCVSYLNVLMDTNKMRHTLSSVVNNTSKDKPRKVFISHKKEDKQYADALINLITFIIGREGNKIFCSSVPGYGIRQSQNIMNDLLTQFDNFEIFMVIIHSPRYYKSAICLNEMGASWVLGTKFSSFMTKDCKPSCMKGVINRNWICIDPKDDRESLNAHLNDFKDDLIAFFNAPAIEENKWENARDRFIREILTY